MFRSLLIALMMMLSFQSVWSMAANACMHEQTDSVSHFGHHQGQHGETRGDVGVDATSDADRSDVSNFDHHHVLGVSLLPHLAAQTPIADEVAHVHGHGDVPYRSTSIAALERPPRTLADVRSARLG